MARKLSQAAQVAKLLKQKAKELGLVATASSKNFSMGCSVNVRVTKGTDTALEKLKEYSNQYEYGQFNGMEDLYEITNSRDDIPQTKYLFVEDKRADTIIQENLDQTQVRFYEHEFAINNYDYSSWQWLGKLKAELGEDWQNVLKKLLQDFDGQGIQSVTYKSNGLDFVMLKKEAA